MVTLWMEQPSPHALDLAWNQWYTISISIFFVEMTFNSSWFTPYPLLSQSNLFSLQ